MPGIAMITARRERIMLLRRIIERSGEIEVDKLVAMFSINQGLRPAKVREYLNTLNDFGVIEFKDGMVRIKEVMERGEEEG